MKSDVITAIEPPGGEAVQAAGFTDEQIIDIAAETALSFTTNLCDNTFTTDMDEIVPPLKTRYAEQATQYATVAAKRQLSSMNMSVGARVRFTWKEGEVVERSHRAQAAAQSLYLPPQADSGWFPILIARR